MNLSLDSGNTPRSFRLFRLAEHSTPDHSFESCSRFIDIGSINGIHLHKLCRPVSESDAKEKRPRTQGLEAENRGGTLYADCSASSATFIQHFVQGFIQCAGELRRLLLAFSRD